MPEHQDRTRGKALNTVPRSGNLYRETTTNHVITTFAHDEDLQDHSMVKLEATVHSSEGVIALLSRQTLTR